MFVTWFSLCRELVVKCIVWALHLVVVVVVVTMFLLLGLLVLSIFSRTKMSKWGRVVTPQF